MSHPEIPYQIIRSSRKTLALEITPEGRVLARLFYEKSLCRFEN